MITVFWIFLLVVAFILIAWLTGVEWIYLCRVSILSGAFLGALPVVALTPGYKSLVHGAFDIQDGVVGGVFGFCLFIAIWAVSATSDAVLEAGKLRIGDTITRDDKLVRHLRSVLLVLVILLNWNTIRYVSEGHRVEVSVGFWIGILIGLFCYWLERRVATARRKGEGAGPRVANRSAVVHFPQEFSFPQWLTAGYLRPAGTGLDLSEVHVKALAAFTLTLIIYFGIGLWTATSSYKLAASCYLTLATTVLVWLFGALTFFFDKYRIPVLLPFALWVWIGSENQKTDHFFHLSVAPEEIGGTDPAEVLARARSDRKPIVLVAAAGGGIQAAGWTVQVLSGLERILDEKVQPKIFVRSVRLLSGVSGGSTGVMYYVNSAYPVRESATAEQDTLDKAVTAAESSSLESAVRGLAYTDLGRLLVPFFILNRFHDRAQELEQAWIENGDSACASLKIPSLSGATLEGWRSDLSKGKRPAVIFNSTVVETGQRFSFSTSHLEKNQIAQGQDDFDRLYSCSKGCPDMKVATAVRLSATFPVISPAARPYVDSLLSPVGFTDTGTLHFVDGGYFDNSGLVALSTWLDGALKDLVANRPSELPSDILVIQILPFPNPSVGGDSGIQGSSFFQAAAPAQTVVDVWKVETGFSQREFSFVVKRWQLEKDHRVNITFVAIAFPQVAGAENPPLSWHLSDKEKAQIQQAWTEMAAKSDSVRQITEFFEAQLAKQAK
jgi:hypothetical protein